MAPAMMYEGQRPSHLILGCGQATLHVGERDIGNCGIKRRQNSRAHYGQGNHAAVFP